MLNILAINTSLIITASVYRLSAADEPMSRCNKSMHRLVRFISSSTCVILAVSFEILNFKKSKKYTKLKLERNDKSCEKR